MDKQEAKKYIIRQWSLSSGSRITKMLQKYWKLEKKESNIISAAEELFDAKAKSL